jgi:hypothetical protein
MNWIRHCCAAVVLTSLAACPSESQPRDAPASPAAVSGEARAKVETIHPQAGQRDCTEMYGSCTDPPDRICTSTALVVGCGETAQRPNSHVWLKCVCP